MALPNIGRLWNAGAIWCRLKIGAQDVGDGFENLPHGRIGHIEDCRVGKTVVGNTFS